ncbi:hypothetical protein IscW_ISCW011797 [Ixodes scapularis]|uniref:Uncharacterized protein n=1 Tax=Ixodes scapularis TaxID=6945 RepID=B7Q782_IXOSC|nr:hypothetical protein IscW_ISCW011797 [Ixodes scapularis]|eukprot:XP_002412124.1 hypothetical protein IscW_ISCW011797 [Ixodes scapularis]
MAAKWPTRLKDACNSGKATPQTRCPRCVPDTPTSANGKPRTSSLLLLSLGSSVYLDSRR